MIIDITAVIVVFLLSLLLLVPEIYINRGNVVVVVVAVFVVFVLSCGGVGVVKHA